MPVKVCDRAPLGGLLLTQLAGAGAPHLRHFHMIYGVVAASGMASLCVALWVLRGQQEPQRHTRGQALTAVLRQFRIGVREILMDRRVLLTSNMEGVQNLSVGALEAFLPIYTVAICGFSAFQAGLLWGVQIVATVAAKPLMGRISDRHGRRPILFWGMFVCAVPFFFIPWVRNYAALMVLAAVFGLGEALVTSSAAALVADFCEDRHLGSVMGTFGTLFDIGHASGPLLAGVLIGLSGGSDFRASFALIAALMMAAALAFRFGVPEGREPVTHLSDTR